VGELVVGLRFEVEDVHYYEWDISIEGHRLIEVKAEMEKNIYGDGEIFLPDFLKGQFFLIECRAFWHFISE